MNPIFRISRRRRLAAYKRAGELLATHGESYMCLALRGALRLEKLEALEAFRFADAVWCDLYEEGGDRCLSLASAVYVDDYEDAGVDVRNPLALGLHRRSIRLTMVAFLHALDEAGDLEAILS